MGRRRSHALKGRSRRALPIEWPSGSAIERELWFAGEFLIEVENIDFVALQIRVLLTFAVSLDERTGTAKLESKGFELIGPGLEGVGKRFALESIHLRHSLKPHVYVTKQER